MKRSFYHISNKLRECAKFLLAIKNFGSFENLFSTLKPEHFDLAVEAIKVISKYDCTTRSFKTLSLALHFRTSLKVLCDLAVK